MSKPQPKPVGELLAKAGVPRRGESRAEIEANEKFNRIVARRSEIRRQINELDGTISGHAEDAKVAKSTVERWSDALASDGNTAATVSDNTDFVADLRKKRSTLRRESFIAEEAQQIAVREMEAAKAQAHRDAAQKLHEIRKEREREFALDFLRWSQDLDNLLEFRRQLHEAGYDTSRVVSGPTFDHEQFFRDPRSEDSDAGWMVQRFIDCGLLTLEQVADCGVPFGRKFREATKDNN